MSVYVQNDWDYPGVAGNFGWSIRSVQRKFACPFDGERIQYNDCRQFCAELCKQARDRLSWHPCDHSGTDGTVDCQCGVTAGEFISAAREWLDHDGATADDPGYFTNS